ncbi:MAG: LytTR family DNA-binding domain-containing protein [Bacteroidota bacterium]
MGKNLTAVIVDDERLARKELNSLLREHENITIVGEADDVTSAMSVIDEQNPDVIFLDIQMPGESGFDLLNKIDREVKVIFVTAFDEFAIRAFEINALDYLLKPINPDRLKISIERLEQDNIEKSEFLKPINYEDHLLLTINNKLKFIKTNTIIAITAAGDYSNLIFTNDKKGLTLKSMKEWETRLPESHFCRIHRSNIINLNFVDHIEEWFNNSFKVYLNNKSLSLIMSRRFVSNLRKKMA